MIYPVFSYWGESILTPGRSLNSLRILRDDYVKSPMSEYTRSFFFQKMIEDLPRLYRTENVNRRTNKKLIMFFLRRIIEENLPLEMESVFNYYPYTDYFTFRRLDPDKLDRNLETWVAYGNMVLYEGHYNPIHFIPNSEGYHIETLFRRMNAIKYQNTKARKALIEEYRDFLGDNLYIFDGATEESSNQNMWYVVRFDERNVTPLSNYAEGLIRSMNWIQFWRYIKDEKSEWSNFLPFRWFINYCADICDAQDIGEDDIFSDLIMNADILEEFLIVVSDDLENNILDSQVIRFITLLGTIFIQGFDELNGRTLIRLLSHLLLLIHFSNDYTFFKATIIKVLHDTNISPYDLSIRGHPDFGSDVTNYIYYYHLVEEPLMCQFHRFIFDYLVNPRTRYNSEICQQIRENWSNICAVQEPEGSEVDDTKFPILL